MMKEPTIVTNLKLAELVMEYNQSENRLILLDYDGTLVGLKNHPEEVVPGKSILSLIEKLSEDNRNTVAIITGRDQKYISKWFGNMKVYIFAEHGSFMKEPSPCDWVTLYNGEQAWKKTILPVLETFTRENPGSSIEQKKSSFTWHYRNIPPEKAILSIQGLLDKLNEHISPEMNVQVIEGKKVIEIKEKGYDKGKAASWLLQLKNFPFVLCIGDDITDEDMFAVLPPTAYTFKVGYGVSRAGLNIEHPEAVLELLSKLVDTAR